MKYRFIIRFHFHKTCHSSCLHKEIALENILNASLLTKIQNACRLGRPPQLTRFPYTFRNASLVEQSLVQEYSYFLFFFSTKKFWTVRNFPQNSVFLVSLEQPNAYYTSMSYPFCCGIAPSKSTPSAENPSRVEIIRPLRGQSFHCHDDKDTQSHYSPNTVHSDL